MTSMSEVKMPASRHVVLGLGGLVILALGAVSGSAAAETVFKCAGADGGMHYQSSRCSKDAQVSSWASKAVASNEGGGTEAEKGYVFTVVKGQFGMFWTQAGLNGYSADSMIDSGASHLAIPTAVAKTIGAKCEEATRSQTANGSVEVCTTTIKTVTLGSITLRNVNAFIMPNVTSVLIGQEVLRKLKVVQEGGRLNISIPSY